MYHRRTRRRCDHVGMAQETDNLKLVTAVTTEPPTFSITLRGYHKREVDQYARLIEAHLGAVAAERRELLARVRALTEQLQLAQTEVLDLRRRPAVGDKVTFRHLGPRVEHILTEAEEQAAAIREAAAGAMARERALADQELADARARHARAVQEFEVEMTNRKRELDEDLVGNAARAEVREAKAHAQRIRTESEAVLASAYDEAKRVTAAATAAANQARADAAARLQAVHARAEEDAAALGGTADTYARQTREAAEADAQQTRAAAEHHAQQTRAAADQAANQIRSQAEQHATHVRAAAEEYATSIHAGVRRAALQLPDVEVAADSPAAGSPAADSPADSPAADSPAADSPGDHEDADVPSGAADRGPNRREHRVHRRATAPGPATDAYGVDDAVRASTDGAGGEPVPQ